LEAFGELELRSDTLPKVTGGEWGGRAEIKIQKRHLSALFTSACLKKVTSVEAL